MKSILELKDDALNLKEEMKSLIENGEAEKRELNEDETSKLAEIRAQIDEIEKQITEAEAENRKENNKEIKVEKRTMEIRLFDLVKGIVNGNLSDEQRQYVNGMKINYRGTIKAGTEGAGQENVPEDKKGLDVAIRNASVLNKIGCTWFGNAVGDVSIPRYHGSNVQWKGESVVAEDGASAFTETILKPKRLTAYIDISKQFLAQDSNDAEAILIKDLADAVAEKLDKTVFGAASGSTDIPAGLFNGDYVTTGTNLTAITYNDVLDLESAVEAKNGTNFIFVANPKVKYALKGTQMASGLQMVWNAGEVDGYKAVVSNSVNEKSVLCLDPRDLAVATWSGVEITVDPYTRSTYNEVRIVVNYLVDAKLRGDRISGAIFS